MGHAPLCAHISNMQSTEILKKLKTKEGSLRQEYKPNVLVKSVPGIGDSVLQTRTEWSIGLQEFLQRPAEVSIRYEIRKS